jgi:cyclophilin family peptidyl-prolyl cis-trans isomerase
MNEFKQSVTNALRYWETRRVLYNAVLTAVAMKKAQLDDFTGSKKAHDEAEKLRVEYLIAERADSDDENTLAMSATGRNGNRSSSD